MSGCAHNEVVKGVMRASSSFPRMCTPVGAVGGRFPRSEIRPSRSFGRLLTRSMARYIWRMHPLVSIGLVFLTAFLWLAFTLLMLSRVNAAERRALRRARKADRMKTRRVRRAAVSEGTRLAHRQRLRMLKRHPTSAPPSPG